MAYLGQIAHRPFLTNQALLSTAAFLCRFRCFEKETKKIIIQEKKRSWLISGNAFLAVVGTFPDACIWVGSHQVIRVFCDPPPHTHTQERWSRWEGGLGRGGWMLIDALFSFRAEAKHPRTRLWGQACPPWLGLFLQPTRRGGRLPGWCLSVCPPVREP